MVLLKKEPVHKLVTYRLESASKAVVTTASALIRALVVSVWTNCNQYRTNRLLKDADLKYRAIRICLPGDDPDIAFLEKHFTIERDEEKIRREERKRAERYKDVPMVVAPGQEEAYLQDLERGNTEMCIRDSSI